MVSLAPNPAPQVPRGLDRLRPNRSPDQSRARRRLRLPTELQFTPRLVAGAVVVVVAMGVAGGSVLARSSAPSQGIVLRDIPLTPAAKGRTTVLSETVRTTSGPKLGAPSPSTLPIAVSSSAPQLVVHAAGAVKQPGVYVMASGARAADVVYAAGGLSPDADGDRVNLAQPVIDGSRLYIPRRGSTVPLVPPEQLSGGAPPAGGTATGVDGAPGNAPIDLNTATVVQLDALPGVGPATAASIVEYRTKIGRFKSVNQLLDVPGIGEAKLTAMRKRLVVG
jgi:competence protein ComEA